MRIPGVRKIPAAAIGKPKFVTADMVKPGAVVIDVGINRLPPEAGGGLCGDVDFEAVKPIARAITPVPGGVGPMTIAMLLANTLTSAVAFRRRNRSIMSTENKSPLIGIVIKLRFRFRPTMQAAAVMLKRVWCPV